MRTGLAIAQPTVGVGFCVERGWKGLEAEALPETVDRNLDTHRVLVCSVDVKGRERALGARGMGDGRRRRRKDTLL